MLTIGSQYSASRFKDGIPTGWPHKEQPSKWSKGEKEAIADSLNKLPENLLSSNLKGFYRAKKSRDFPNPASHSDGMIVIYDSAFDNKSGLERILAHELSHQN